jgi:hypothetical protein
LHEQDDPYPEVCARDFRMARELAVPGVKLLLQAPDLRQ